MNYTLLVLSVFPLLLFFSILLMIGQIQQHRHFQKLLNHRGLLEKLCQHLEQKLLLLTLGMIFMS